MKAQIRMIIASVIVIALALTAVSGITYSWFSDTEEMDIDITTGKVAIGMDLVQLKDKSSYDRDATTDFTADYTFGVTATATYTVATTGSNAKLTLSKMADNDALLVTFKVTNTSTIDTVYRVSASTSGGLAKYVDTEFTLGGKTTNDATAWTEALVSSGNSRNVTGTLLIKFNSDGAANDSTDTASIALKVEAYQANTTELPELTVSQTVEANETVEKTFNNGNDSVSSVGVSFTATVADTYNISSITTTENNSYTINSGTGSDMKVISGIAVSGSDGTDLSSQGAILTYVLNSSFVNTSANPVALGSGYTIIHQKSNGEIDTSFSLTPVVSGTTLETAGQYILTSNSDGTYTMKLFVTGFSAYLAVQDADASTSVNGNTICYGTIGEAINAASENGEVDILRDVEVCNTITIEKLGLVLDLNGYTVSQATSFSNTDYSTGLINVKSGLTIKNGDLKAIDGNSNRVINIQDLTSDTSLTLNDVNVIGPENGSYTRGISAYKNSGKIDINISGGSVSANYYAINIASDNTEIIVDVNNSAVSSGYCAAQTHSSNSEMTFTDCTLIGKNKYSGSSDDFATVVLNTTATGSKITLNNCTIEASQTGTANEQFMSLRCSSFNIELDNCNYIWKGNAIDVTEMMEEPLTYIHTYYSFDYVYDNNKLTLSAPVSSE